MKTTAWRGYLSWLNGRLLIAGSPFWRLYLTFRGVECTRRIISIGRPGIKKVRGSRIILGDRVVLCSSEIANPVARGSACRLATLHRAAVIRLGDGVGLSSSLVCAATSVEIGEGTIIGGDCMIFDTDFHPRNELGEWGMDPVSVSKPISIGRKCFIGARSIILKGVTIGDHAVVGAGSVVASDVPQGAVVVGNPARIVRIIERYANGE
jgi:acetyltransferase-like isoleucine patch superfamily enzyme